jgi:hypothetical protein
MEAKMNEIVKKSKWFWAWQDDKEEAWLREMARQGLHLKTPDLFGQYTFVQGEPRDVVYRFDFVTMAKKNEDYFQLFRDAGWEHVGEIGGWQYWRKEVRDGKASEIFTDSDSKVRKYQRLVGYLSLFISIFVINFITISISYTHAHSSFVNGLLTGIFGILFVAFIMMVVFMLMILKRISILKRK